MEAFNHRDVLIKYSGALKDTRGTGVYHAVGTKCTGTVTLTRH
jgi:hypothetical protein